MKKYTNNERNIPSIKIRKIKFNNNEEITLNEDDIVVLVGANNVGKSRALKDIQGDLRMNSESKRVVVTEVEYDVNNFTPESIRDFLDRNFYKDSYRSYQINNSFSYWENNIEDVTSSTKELYQAFTTFLSTENRLQITAPIAYNNIENRANFNIMKALESNASYIERLNKFLLFAFEKAIDVDNEEIYGGEGKTYKIGTKDEINKTINSNRREANLQLKDLEQLHEQGDGIRSAVGILASLIVNESSLFLIDEPETFLHPPQARLLGNNIVELSQGKQCIISTHNIDFIRGVLEKGAARVKIVKIDRNENENEFHTLDNDSIQIISKDKNLKYSNILNGLFYSKVVLTENETDCKFYSAILENIDSKTYQDTLFCGVGGKDQFKLIIPLLQKLKINYLVIADIDLINDKERLKQLLNAVKENGYNTISDVHKSFLIQYEEGMDSQVKTQAVLRAEILDLFTEDRYIPDENAEKIKTLLKEVNKLKLLKEGGVSIMPSGECTKNFHIINENLMKDNIYILECGEIERFIKEVKGHGNAWVEEVFREYPNFDDPIYTDAKNFVRKVFNI